MVRTLACLFLCVGSALGADEKTPKQPGVPQEALTVIIFGERGDKTVQKAAEALRRIEANDPMMGDPDKGQGTFATVMVRPGTPSKQVAAVVSALLDAGVGRVTVRVTVGAYQKSLD
jgi:hypothetical protein